jgi:hypothetical protein
MSRITAFSALLILVTAGTAFGQPRDAVVFALFDNPEPHHGCIVPTKSQGGGWDELAIGRCDSPAASFVFDEKARRIRSARDPKLCWADTTGAGAAPFNAILRDCTDDGVGQFYTYNKGSKRIVSLNGDNREDADSFCFFMGRQRGQRTPVLSEPCNGRNAKIAQIVFFLTPRAAIASAATGAQPSPSVPPSATPKPGATQPSAPQQIARSPSGKAGAWTLDSSSTSRGFSACRASRMTDSGEIRIGLDAALDMSMSTPADRAMAPAGTRAQVKLTVGADTETVPGSVNAEGRLGFTLPLPLARTMVERPPREMTVEGPDGMSLVPLAGFRAVWDALNACVNAQGRR